jgi:hypothetical protein
MRAWILCLGGLALAACAHTGQSVVATMPTVGPRGVILQPEYPLAPTSRGALCLQAPEGYAVQASVAAFFPQHGDAVRVHATLAQEDSEARLDLSVPSRRNVGNDAFLCLGTGAPAPAGVAFDRVSIEASATLLLPQIVWIAEPK